MSIFALMAIGGTGFGPIYAGWVEINPKLEWKWIQWIHMMQVIPRLTLTESVTKKNTVNSDLVECICYYSHSSWEKRVRRLFWQEWQRNSEKQLEIIGIVREWKMNEQALPTWFSYHVLDQFVS